MEMIQIEIKQKIGVICVQQQETIPISRNLELNKGPLWHYLPNADVI